MNNQRLEHKNHSHSAGNFFTGLLMGVLLGGGTMMVLAPQSGEKTRVKIQAKTTELRDQAVEALEDAAAQAREKVRLAGSDVFKHAEELALRGQAIFDGQTPGSLALGEAARATQPDSQR